MAYLKPNPFVNNVFNPLAKRFGLGGAQTLVVRRRVTGAAQELPVIPVEHEGKRYVVSTRGEAEWVRNVRAAGEVELHGKGSSARFAAVEVPLADAPPIIDHYREVAGRTVDGYWRKLPEPADHPVFRLEPR